MMFKKTLLLVAVAALLVAINMPVHAEGYPAPTESCVAQIEIYIEGSEAILEEIHDIVEGGGYVADDVIRLVLAMESAERSAKSAEIMLKEDFEYWPFFVCSPMLYEHIRYTILFEALMEFKGVAQ